MREIHLRRAPDRRENLSAFAVALGVGVATFYVVRALLSRDVMPAAPSRLIEKETGGTE